MSFFKNKKVIATGLASTLALATPFIAEFEGNSNVAYRDAIGVWTICYGSTSGVRPGDTATDQQCIDLLDKEVLEFAQKVDDLVITDMKPQVHAAMTSFSYNVGIGAFAKSTALRKLNNRDTVGACNELLRWNKAGGKVLPGLTRRREAERQLCLSGV